MDWRKCANEEERIFLEQLVSCIQKADKQYRGFATSFYQKQWMEEVIKKYMGLHMLTAIQFEGGFEAAERQVACYGYEVYEESPVKVLEIVVKIGIGKPLGHRDFLGALIGLGIERSKFGDIVIMPKGAYVSVTKELAEYICWHLTGIGRYNKLTITEIAREEMIIENRQFKEILGTVQSLRADALFALAFSISRTTAVKLLQQDKGTCNGMQVKSSDILKVGDVGTLRGFGKMRFASINGTTKKDRIHIKIEKYI